WRRLSPVLRAALRPFLLRLAAELQPRDQAEEEADRISEPALFRCAGVHAGSAPPPRCAGGGEPDRARLRPPHPLGGPPGAPRLRPRNPQRCQKGRDSRRQRCPPVRNDDLSPAEPRMNPRDPPDPDARLRDDIRLLGRILGDTVRQHEGEATFAVVESIRQTSIRFHREEDETARKELEATLGGLSGRQAIQIIRAFSYFSQLANIAEDQNQLRRLRLQALGGERATPGTMAHALARARDAGLSRHELQ